MKKLEKIYGLRMPMTRRWLNSKFRIWGGSSSWFQQEMRRISVFEDTRLANIFGDYLGIPSNLIEIGVHSLLTAPPHNDRAEYWYARSFFYVIRAPRGSYIENEKGKKVFLEANCLYVFNQFVEHWVCNEGSVIELLTISHMKKVMT